MAKIRGAQKRPCSSLESTASSPFVAYTKEDGEEVVGPVASDLIKRNRLMRGSGSRGPHGWICDVCGGEYKTKPGLFSHKRCHLNWPLRSLWRPMPLPPSLRTPIPLVQEVRPIRPLPKPRVSLELGLGVGNGGPIPRQKRVRPMPTGPTREMLWFKEWFAQAKAARKNKEGVSNVACNFQTMYDERLELKLGI